jgi:hypothetical protein
MNSWVIKISNKLHVHTRFGCVNGIQRAMAIWNSNILLNLLTISAWESKTSVCKINSWNENDLVVIEKIENQLLLILCETVCNFYLLNANVQFYKDIVLLKSLMPYI